MVIACGPMGGPFLANDRVTAAGAAAAFVAEALGQRVSRVVADPTADMQAATL